MKKITEIQICKFVSHIETDSSADPRTAKSIDIWDIIKGYKVPLEDMTIETFVTWAKIISLLVICMVKLKN